LRCQDPSSPPLLKIFFEERKEKNPREQRKLGRAVRKFNKVEWDKVNLEIVKSINYDKFNQNIEWGELLLLTNHMTIVEASPVDAIWGVGYSEDDPYIFKYRAKWGENRLGRAIMLARDDLRQNVSTRCT
jgi:ribA/ribD-fused uncharacterized protein